MLACNHMLERIANPSLPKEVCSMIPFSCELICYIPYWPSSKDVNDHGGLILEIQCVKVNIKLSTQREVYLCGARDWVWLENRGCAMKECNLWTYQYKYDTVFFDPHPSPISKRTRRTLSICQQAAAAAAVANVHKFNTLLGLFLIALLHPFF